jgi:hypothetical protein
MNLDACDYHEKNSANDERTEGFACYYMSTSGITTDMVWAVNADLVTPERGYPINLAPALA